MAFEKALHLNCITLNVFTCAEKSTCVGLIKHSTFIHIKTQCMTISKHRMKKDRQFILS